MRDVYVGPGGVLAGSARLAQEASENAAHTLHDQETQRRRVALQHRRETLEAQIAAMRAECELQEAEVLTVTGEDQARQAQMAQERAAMARSRQADLPEPTAGRLS